MYSLVLMMAMSADVPQDVFPNRPGILFAKGSGCNGASAGCSGARVGLFHRSTGCAGSQAVRAAGCGGSAVAFSTGCAGSGAVLARATGCAGGTAVVVGMIPVAASGPQIVTLAQTGPLVLGSKPTTVTLQPVAAQPSQFGRGLVERRRVERQLRIALRSGNLTPDEKAVAEQALADPDVYDASVSKITRDLNKQLAAKESARPGSVGALGDGHILQLILQNMPQIIAAIKQIIALFGPHALLVPVHDWAPLPAGPYPPASVRVPHWLAC